MLTVDADQHAGMNRFHARDEEKRMLVMLEPDHIELCLQATTDEAVTLLWHLPR
jgi:hypothetical protein